MRKLTAHRRLYSLIIIGIIALALTSGCSATKITTTSTTSSTSSQTNTTTTAYTEPLDFVSAVDSTYRSVVAIEVIVPPQGGSQQASQAAGSGFILDSNGLIATNDHVVTGAQTINVILADGRKFTATAVKTNPSEDLAVVKINATGLPAAQIGDSSQLKMGQPVAPIGNSLDMGVRVTSGVVSRLGVTITYNITSQTSITLDNLIETDATINPGNSGGALVNLSGQVVGITNAGLSGSTTDVVGFGYAIAINHAISILNTLASQLP
jgi:serine protease Do